MHKQKKGPTFLWVLKQAITYSPAFPIKAITIGFIYKKDRFISESVPKAAITYSPAFAVPSALQGLTSLFGMGRGGALVLSSPEYGKSHDAEAAEDTAIAASMAFGIP